MTSFLKTTDMRRAQDGTLARTGSNSEAPMRSQSPSSSGRDDMPLDVENASKRLITALRSDDIGSFRPLSLSNRTPHIKSSNRETHDKAEDELGRGFLKRQPEGPIGAHTSRNPSQFSRSETTSMTHSSVQQPAALSSVETSGPKANQQKRDLDLKLIELDIAFAAQTRSEIKMSDRLPFKNSAINSRELANVYSAFADKFMSRDDNNLVVPAYKSVEKEQFFAAKGQFQKIKKRRNSFFSFISVLTFLVLSVIGATSFFSYIPEQREILRNIWQKAVSFDYDTSFIWNDLANGIPVPDRLKEFYSNFKEFSKNFEFNLILLTPEKLPTTSKPQDSPTDTIEINKTLPVQMQFESPIDQPNFSTDLDQNQETHQAEGGSNELSSETVLSNTIAPLDTDEQRIPDWSHILHYAIISGEKKLVTDRDLLPSAHIVIELEDPIVPITHTFPMVKARPTETESETSSVKASGKIPLPPFFTR